MNHEDSEIKRQHDQEQLEAAAEAMDVTICPVPPGHPAFPEIILAALSQPHHLTQQQIQDILDKYEDKI